MVVCGCSKSGTQAALVWAGNQTEEGARSAPCRQRRLHGKTAVPRRGGGRRRRGARQPPGSCSGCGGRAGRPGSSPPRGRHLTTGGPPPLSEPPLILHTARAAGLLHGCWQCWVPQGLVRCRPGQCCGGGGRRGAGSTCGVAGSMPLRSAKSSMKRAESQVLCNVSGSRIGSSLVPATRSWWLWWSVVCQEGGPWLRPSHSMRAARAWFSLRMASSRRHPWSLPQKEGAHLWQPPEEQKGDGRTALNDKFGY